MDEFQQTWHQMKSALDDSREANRIAISQMNARLDQIETTLRRPPLASATNPYTTPPNADARLFFKAVALGGPQNLRDSAERAKAEAILRASEVKMAGGPAEQKALALGDDALGGFLAPSEFSAEVVKGVQVISQIRPFAKVRQTAFRSVDIPVRSGTFSAVWVGETQTRTETTGLSYAMESLVPSELYAYVVISLQDLEDSQLDLAAEIASEAAEQFAVAEGKAFVAGTGVRQPEGFMVNAAISHVASGDANLLKADGLINLLYALKESYARNARFLLNRKSVGAIRLLKNTQDVYIWSPSYADNSPATILGVPYSELPDMADVGAAAYPVAIADLSRGYQIVDRVGLGVQRLNEKFAEQGQVAFLVRKRVAGQVIVPEAFKKLEIASS